MNDNKKQDGIVKIIIGMMLIFGVKTLRYYMCKSSEYTGTNIQLDEILSVIDSLSVIIKYIGIFVIIIGVYTLALNIINPYIPSYEAYNHLEKTLVFFILDGKKKKNIYVKLGNLSENAINILRKKTEKPLETLYDIANNGKRAKEEYRNCEVYITSLAEDLQNAVNQCKNELMEQKLLDKLYIIENAIKKITVRVHKANTADKDEERILKDLELESFEPFAVTDNMNKLEDDYIENTSKYDNLTSVKTETISEIKEDKLDSYTLTNEIHTFGIDDYDSIWNN